MKNCKDCLHIECCELVAKTEEEYTGCATVHDYSYASKCECFRNRSEFVEVVHGRWEEWCGLPKCPVCGYEYTDYLECKNYCGNCGTKMDGETLIKSPQTEKTEN